MKKFFKDDTLEAQKITKEAAALFFKVPEEQLDNLINKEKFIVLLNFKQKDYSFQIAFNTVERYDNNSYLVQVFNLNDELVGYFGYSSHTTYPPVWNREFGYIDYTDYLGIQKKINELLTRANLPNIDYDFSLNKKCYYFTKETKEEVESLIKEKRPYSIVSIFAEKKPELAEISKKIIGF